MFKIGNSKELPPIPDSLSEDGKDFIRQCLQRNPIRRPTAAQLLEHPFVKNAAPLDRPVINIGPEPSEAPSSGTNGVKPLVCSLLFFLCNSVFKMWVKFYLATSRELETQTTFPRCTPRGLQITHLGLHKLLHSSGLSLSLSLCLYVALILLKIISSIYWSMLLEELLSVV